MIGAALLFPLFLSAADDPFVGDWRYRQDMEKGEQNYKILQVGENKFQVESSVGLGSVLPTDGSVQESPFGGTVSLKQTSANTFLYVMNRNNTVYKRVMTVDGDTMKWDEDQELDTGKHSTGQTVWHRAGHGHGLAGNWEMASYHDDQEPGIMTIKKTATGLAFKDSTEDHVNEMYFDGKEHPSKAPHFINGVMETAERVNERTIHVVSKRNGKIIYNYTFSLSADGKMIAAKSTDASGKTVDMAWERINP